MEASLHRQPFLWTKTWGQRRLTSGPRVNCYCVSKRSLSPSSRVPTRNNPWSSGVVSSVLLCISLTAPACCGIYRILPLFSLSPSSRGAGSRLLRVYFGRYRPHQWITDLRGIILFIDTGLDWNVYYIKLNGNTRLLSPTKAEESVTLECRNWNYKRLENQNRPVLLRWNATGRMVTKTLKWDERLCIVCVKKRTKDGDGD